MAKSRSKGSIAVRRGLREIGEHVQAWRKLRGMTQAQLAERADVARTTVIRLERDEGSVSLESALKIMNALGVLGNLTSALDPYSTDLGRVRSSEKLPERVRPRDLTR